MPIPSETKRTNPPTIQARSSAELSKPSVRIWLLFSALWVVTNLLLIPPQVVLYAGMTGLLFSLVTWAAVRVR